VRHGTEAGTVIRLLLLLAGTAQAQPSAAADGPWWLTVQDPRLHQLIRDGLQHNPQVAAADAQARAAQAGQGEALSGLLPSISVEIQGQQMPTDGLSLSPASSQMTGYGAAFEGLAELMSTLAASTGQDPSTLPSFEFKSEPLPDTYSQGSAMLVATLPLDIVGRQTQRYLASRRTADGASFDLKAQRLNTTLMIADGWYDLVAARMQAQIIGGQMKTNQDLLSLVKVRYEGGDATALDVLQQRQQLAVTEAMLPRAQAQVATADLALRSVLGHTGEADLPPGASLPALPPSPPLGDPGTPRARRPDLAAAFSRLEAARHQRTAALLGLAPTVGLTGSAGRQFLHMDETDHADTWSVGAALSVPLFLGGRTHAGIRAATARRDLAQAQLRAQVLAVSQEVRSAEVNERASTAAHLATQRQARVAKAAYEESRARFIEGVMPYINVLTALAAYQTAELSLLDAHRTRLRARVRLHGALGSPWSPTSEATP
jgi:outer membrane protein TolC